MKNYHECTYPFVGSNVGTVDAIEAFLTAALDGDEWSIHASAAFFSSFSFFFTFFYILVVVLLLLHGVRVLVV